MPSHEANNKIYELNSVTKKNKLKQEKHPKKKRRRSTRHLRHSPRLQSKSLGSIWVPITSAVNRYGFIGRFNCNKDAKLGLVIVLDTNTANDAVMSQAKSNNCVPLPNGTVVTPNKKHTMDCDAQLAIQSPGGRQYQAKFFLYDEEAQNTPPSVNRSLCEETLEEMDVDRLEKSLEKMPPAQAIKENKICISTKKIAKKREVTQAKVMHISAANYIAILANNNLCPTAVLEKFKVAGEARPEWAHGVAISLGGAQAAENLFVVTRACNTEMWIAEYYVHTLRQQNGVKNLTVSFKAHLVHDYSNQPTHVASCVDYCIEWQDNNDQKHHKNFKFDGLRQVPPSHKILKCISLELHEELLQELRHAVQANDQFLKEVERHSVVRELNFN